MELKNNQGVLFKNEKTKETHPDFTGEVNIEGKMMRIALWKKQSSKGVTYLSIQLGEKENVSNKPAEKKEEKHESFIEDSIPF